MATSVVQNVPANDDGKESTNTDADEPSSAANRQTLIDTAVRFLQNPKVVPTPLENKRLFLTKKGLTDEETEIALRTAGCYNVQMVNPVQPLQQQPVQNQYNQQQLQSQQYQYQTLQPPHMIMNENSLSTKIFRIIKWVANIVFAGCVAFTAYKLLVKKYFLKQKSKAEVNMEAVLDTNKQLQQTVQEMRQSLKSLNIAVESMSSAVRQLSIERNSSQSNTNDSDIKAEIQSVKSLLLNRTQFPAIPTVTPILPSWQLGLNNKKETESKSGSEANHDSIDADLVKIEKYNGTATSNDNSSFENDK